MMVNIDVNGKEYKKDIEPRMLLVSFLRNLPHYKSRVFSYIDFKNTNKL